jgi:poly(3-hydroxybutyrate) depolymerase
VRVSGDNLPVVYTQALTLQVVPAGATHRESFLSGVDRSAQYFGVVPPTSDAPAGPKAMVLSLHGAGVQAIGQAAAYAPKDWAWIVAPTNRRPFGFDWEAWGRLDALETLDHAMEVFGADPTRVYLTGHSMGGHGTWNLGVHNPGRFATLGPSAGWSSFYTYGGEAKPEGAFGRARASSDTPAYLSNLARRGVYAIHGTADDNVPVTEGRTLVAQVRAFTDDVELYEQPGAGHWWDGDASAGADCVDWPPLFDFMQAHTLDPFELDFDFRTPSPFITPRHSYVSLRSAESADADCVLSSRVAGDTVTLTTENVRGRVLDGETTSLHCAAHGTSGARGILLNDF